MVSTLALVAVAALAFSILAVVIEGIGARRARRRLQRRASPVLHPLPVHGVARRVRQPLSWRALHHVGLFFGFLLGLLTLRVVYRVVAKWF